MHKRSELDTVYFCFLPVVLKSPTSLVENITWFLFHQKSFPIFWRWQHSLLLEMLFSMDSREESVNTALPNLLGVSHMTQSANQNSMGLTLSLAEKEVLFSPDVTNVRWGEPECLQTVLGYFRSALVLSVW